MRSYEVDTRQVAQPLSVRSAKRHLLGSSEVAARQGVQPLSAWIAKI
jgi:hypothetical protein